MKETQYLAYGIVGFSFSQLLGIMFAGYQYYQVIIIYLILCILCAIPGFIRYGILQRTHNSKLPPHHVLSCFVPSLIGICVLTIGFLIGGFVVL